MPDSSKEEKRNTQRSIKNHYNQFAELPHIRMLLQLQAGSLEVSAGGYSAQETYDLFCLAVERLPEIKAKLEHDDSVRAK